jgi:hypothetical protein
LLNIILLYNSVLVAFCGDLDVSRENSAITSYVIRYLCIVGDGLSYFRLCILDSVTNESIGWKLLNSNLGNVVIGLACYVSFLYVLLLVTFSRNIHDKHWHHVLLYISVVNSIHVLRKSCKRFADVILHL